MDPKKRLGSRRPVYRDSNEDKAVKVYTINQESRYLLVKGIPKISNITEEVLKPFSLYGAIQEYRILDDYPDTEEFTAVYWIKYVEIQSARVAKRKMNKQPFYGSVLNVCYGPEYEDVDDTRQKLIERRKSVVRRLRHLGRNKEAKESQFLNTSKSKISNSESSDSPALDQPRIIGSLSQSDSTGDGPESQSESVSPFPMLPLPPSHLPPAAWNGPSKLTDDSVPSVPSAQATLPAGFSPFNNGRESNICDGTTATDDSDPNYRRMIRERGGGSKTFDKDSTMFFQSRKVPKMDTPASSPWAFSGRRQKAGSRVSKEIQGDQSTLRGGARPKDVPRKRFAWSSDKRSGSIHDEKRQEFLGQRLNPPPLPARNPCSEITATAGGSKETVEWGATPRLKTGVKRPHSVSREAGPSNYTTRPSSSRPSSFDKSVLSIRAKLREATEPPQAVQLQGNISDQQQQQSLQQPSLQRESSRVDESSSHLRVDYSSAAPCQPSSSSPHYSPWVQGAALSHQQLQRLFEAKELDNQHPPGGEYKLFEQ